MASLTAIPSSEAAAKAEVMAFSEAELRLFAKEARIDLLAIEEWLASPPEDTTEHEVDLKLDTMQIIRDWITVYEEVADEIHEQKLLRQEIKEHKKYKICFCHLIVGLCQFCAIPDID